MWVSEQECSDLCAISLRFLKSILVSFNRLNTELVHIAKRSVYQLAAISYQ